MWMMPRRSGPSSGLRPCAAIALTRVRFLQRAPRLRHDLVADGRDQHLALAALEDLHAELVLEVLHRCRQARLAHETALRRAAEMAFGRDGNDVPELGEGHRRE